jgi:hypothetical protein
VVGYFLVTFGFFVFLDFFFLDLDFLDFFCSLAFVYSSSILFQKFIYKPSPQLAVATPTAIYVFTILAILTDFILSFC